MSDDFGLTDEGLKVPRAKDLYDIMREEFEARTGESFDFTPDDPMGSIFATIATRLGDLVQIVKDVYESRDPNNASGWQLDNLAQIVGVRRQEPTAGRIAAQRFAGDLNTAVPEGTLVEGGGPDDRLRWELDEDLRLGVEVEIGTLDTGDYKLDIDAPKGSGTKTVSYTVGPSETTEDALRGLRGKINTKDRVRQTVTAHLEDTRGTPNHDRLIITADRARDFTVSVKSTPGGGAMSVTDGVAYGLVVAEEEGAYEADAGQVDALATPTKGVRSTTNPDDARAGQDRESDDALRLRMRTALQAAGSASASSVEGALLQLDFLRAAIVIDNPSKQTQTIDGVELEPSSGAVVVWPNTLTDDEKKRVIGVLYEEFPLGSGITKDTNNFSSSEIVEGTVTADNGTTKDVVFHFAQAKAVNVDISVALETGFSLADVENQIQDQTESYIEDRQVGDDVRRLRIYGLIDEVRGVERVTQLDLNGSAADVSVDATEKASPSTVVVSN